METFTYTKQVTVNLADIDGKPISEGSVLINVKDQYRGVVVQVGRVGAIPRDPLFSLGDISIKKSAGLYRGTKMYGDWKHIPHDEQTYWERYTSWLYRNYDHDEYANYSKDTGFAIDGILSLLPEDVIDWEGTGGPNNLEEALEILMRHLTLGHEQ